MTGGCESLVHYSYTTRTPLLVHQNVKSTQKDGSLAAFAAGESFVFLCVFVYIYSRNLADLFRQPGGIAAGIDLLGDVRNLVAHHVLDGVFVHLVLLGLWSSPVKFAPPDQVQPVQRTNPVQAHISHAVHGNNALLVDRRQQVSVRVKHIDRGQAIDLQLRG